MKQGSLRAVPLENPSKTVNITLESLKTVGQFQLELFSHGDDLLLLPVKVWPREGYPLGGLKAANMHNVDNPIGSRVKL